jgi:hypothetical protein
MELRDPPAAQRMERGRLDVALDTFETALNGLIETGEAGGLDQLDVAEKVAVWQTLRNLPQPAATHRPQPDCRC